MKNLIIALSVLTLTSCLEKREPMQQERGEVVEKQYAPPINATGTGITSNGDVSFHDIHEDEKFMVVFKCEHQVVFSINNQSLYARLSKGDTVIIDYYELVDGDGKVKDFDFINARKSTEKTEW